MSIEKLSKENKLKLPVEQNHSSAVCVHVCVSSFLTWQIIGI